MRSFSRIPYDKVSMAGDDNYDNPEGLASEEDEGVPDNVVHVDFGRKRPAKAAALTEVFDYDDPAQGAKFEAFAKLIDLGMVMITLDTRVPGVDVPTHLRGISELRLNFSHRFGIEDFAYDERGVRASLSFNGQSHYCVIPWAAVFMLYSHADGKVLVFDLPQ
jgi:hypothetical protein